MVFYRRLVDIGVAELAPRDMLNSTFVLHVTRAVVTSG